MLRTLILFVKEVSNIEQESKKRCPGAILKTSTQVDFIFLCFPNVTQNNSIFFLQLSSVMFGFDFLQVFVVSPVGTIEARDLFNAVDIGLRMFYVLNGKYPGETFILWSFLQIIVFKIPSGKVPTQARFAS